MTRSRSARPGSSPVDRLPPARHRDNTANTPGFDARAALYAVLGVDLTQIHGLGPSSGPQIVGECGTDFSAWPDAKHFTSWLCLAPSNKISGGKVLSSRTRRSGSRAAALLRLAAVTVGRTADSAGRILPPTVGTGRQGQGGHRDRPKDCSVVLQHNASRNGLRRSRGLVLRRAIPSSRPLANLQRRAKALGYVLQEAPILGKLFLRKTVAIFSEPPK